MMQGERAFMKKVISFGAAVMSFSVAVILLLGLIYSIYDSVMSSPGFVWGNGLYLCVFLGIAACGCTLFGVRAIRYYLKEKKKEEEL